MVSNFPWETCHPDRKARPIRRPKSMETSMLETSLTRLSSLQANELQLSIRPISVNVSAYLSTVFPFISEYALVYFLDNSFQILLKLRNNKYHYIAINIK